MSRTLHLFALVGALGSLVACTNKEASSDDSGGDSGFQFHPLVPEEYRYRWDVDGCGDGGAGEAIYKLATAETDAEGNFTGTELWYHFYGGDWSDDCVDTLSYTGTPLSNADINDLDAGEAEEGYYTVRTVAQQNCSEYYGDDTEIMFVFDTLTPSGNLNYENAMLVFRWIEGRNGWRSDLDYARGVFNPTTEALAPPATYTWEGEDCDDGSWP
ncbi:MAG: hypothetical protein H6739_26325 [Alphaproteobacteria bacterium]|nr:hypothetical protein [Alphaproteobacteria bacterium]